MRQITLFSGCCSNRRFHLRHLNCTQSLCKKPAIPWGSLESLAWWRNPCMSFQTLNFPQKPLEITPARGHC